MKKEEHAELLALRKEVKNLRMEKEVLKKASAFFAARSKKAMQQLHRGLEGQYPVTRICNALVLSRSSWYHRSKRKAKVITQEEFRLHRRIKELFNSSRGILGSRQLVKKLASEGINISRTKVRNIMKTHRLKVIQRTAYKVTTKRKHSDSVADNLVNMKFDPKLPNTV